ncbi:MAG: TrkH family potassium uptake protein [Methanotrichaceae archaeon]|nr:TrkH family potassium uptake protein [Methanotrichaceae archaeon]
MKVKIVSSTLGLLAVLLGVLMLVPGLVSAIYREPLGVVAFALTSLLAVALGLALSRLGVGEDMDHKEAFAVVSLGWLLASFIGALPYIFLGMSIMDGLFESMSGFTTAGATTLTEYNSEGYWILNPELVRGSLACSLVEWISVSISRFTCPENSTLILGVPIDLSSMISIKGTYFGLLFWRSFSQLLGGMGIILLFIAILPHLGMAGRQLYYVEGLGLNKESLTPRVKNTAKTFWSIYIGMVVLEAAILFATGLPVYDALCTAFASLATGGFSPKAYSIAAYNSVLVEAVVVLFLIFGGTNFLIHYRLLYKRDFHALTRDPEFKFYLLIMGLAVSILMLWGHIGGDTLNQLRFSSFQVVSTMTTTGFVNNFSYDAWSLAAQLSLILLMLIGGCTGSTGGGIKVGRVLIVLKYAYNELIHALHPKAVVPIRMGETTVRDEIIKSVQLYMLLYLIIFLGASLLFAITESGNPQFNAISAISASAACLGVVGPGFGVVALDFSLISTLGRLLGFLCMYVGRLEIIPIIILFLPDLWKK